MKLGYIWTSVTWHK